MAKAIDLRKKTENELKEMLITLKKELEIYTNDVLKGKIKNLKKAGFLRKDIARVRTIINEKIFMKEVKHE